MLVNLKIRGKVLIFVFKWKFFWFGGKVMDLELGDLGLKIGFDIYKLFEFK